VVANFIISVRKVDVAIVGHFASNGVPARIRFISNLECEVHIYVLTDVRLLDLQNHSDIEASNALLSIPSRKVLNVHLVLVSVERLFFCDDSRLVSLTSLVFFTESIVCLI